MGIRFALNRLTDAVLKNDPYRDPGTRLAPDCVVLDATSGVTPLQKPPVRIFLGSEPAQWRAERVFVWSIMQVRNPARRYEIYLMKELVGFDRRGWLTGFTNYRFAIPHFAGGAGRAIYNDADQIYLVDPAELFDAEMGEHGFLSINDHDTSVMLIDCARMASVWTLESAQSGRRKALEARAREVPGLWGRAHAGWNARDEEYSAADSKVLHYTTIHTQPWRPFPQRFVYQHNPVAYLWTDLEESADRAGFQVYSADRPSVSYVSLLAGMRRQQPACGAQRKPEALPGLREAARELSVDSVLRYTLGGDGAGSKDPVGTLLPEIPVAVHDATRDGVLDAARASADAVVCAEDLDLVPHEDLPWVLETLFAAARRLVYISVGTGRPTGGQGLQGRLRPQPWWTAQIETVAARHPGVRWELAFVDHSSVKPRLARLRQGGNFGAAPEVWVLTSEKPGHSTQSIGLAEAMGWPYTVKTLSFRGGAEFFQRLTAMHRASRAGLDEAASDSLQAPWPDLVITAGWKPARVARWIREQSGGRTRVVLLGRKASYLTDPTDIGVSCTYFQQPPHPRRIETTAPLSCVNRERLKAGAERWHHLLDGSKSPRIMLLVGGSTALHRFDPDTARRLGQEVRELADTVGGKVFATTSRRTGDAATRALADALGESHYLHRWSSDQADDNPYFGFLALADVLVVTGESESMLAEAAATDKPLYIYPLPEKRLSPINWAKIWVFRRAHQSRRKRRGSIKPQRGLTYLCARLIERGIVQPPRDLNALHETLVQRQVASFFGSPLSTGKRPMLREFDNVAEKVRRLLGLAVPT